MRKILVATLSLIFLLCFPLMLSSCLFDEDGTEESIADSSNSESIKNDENSISDGLVYELSENGEYYSLVGIGSCKDSIINIPAEYKSLPVQEIKMGTFFLNYIVKEVNIPETVRKIEPMSLAFNSIEKINVNPNNSEYFTVEGVLFTKNQLIQYPAKKNDTNYVMPDFVEEIRDKYAFAYNDYLQTIELGNITSIPDFAFYDCDGLKEIEITETVQSVGESAFESCENLFKAIVNSEIIGVSAFKNCYNLTVLELGEQVRVNREDSFQYCYKLTEVFNKSQLKIEDSVRNYYTPESGSSKIITTDDGFVLCPDNEYKYTLVNYIGDKPNIVIPDIVENIGKYTFMTRNDIVSITINENVKRIEGFSSDLVRLTEINNNTYFEIYPFWHEWGILVPHTVKRINNVKKESCITFAEDGFVVYKEDDLVSVIDYVGEETEIEIPDYVTEISSFAFYEKNELKSVVIPDSVKTLGESAFSNCANLRSVYIGNGVETIGKDCFKYCTLLNVVTVGNSVVDIQGEVFYGCDNIKYTEYENAYYLGNSENPYYLLVTANNFGDKNKIHEQAVIICDFAFSSALLSGKHNFIKSLIIPDNVRVIGEGAFTKCTIEELEIGRSVEKMEFAFHDNYIDKVIIRGEDITEISNEEFKDVALNEFGNVKYLGNEENPFLIALCPVSSNVENCEIHEKTKIIAGDAFKIAKNLKSVKIGQGVEVIGRNAFLGSGIQSISFPESVKEIGDQAFRECEELRELVLPNTIEKIGVESFMKCVGLETVVVGDGIDVIPERAFYFCENLKEVRIGNNVKVVEREGFSRCYKLADLYIGDSLDTFKVNALDACDVVSVHVSTIERWLNINYSNLRAHPFYLSPTIGKIYVDGEWIKDVVVPENITEIKPYAFYKCSIESVTLSDSVKTIGEGSFASWDILQTIYYKGTKQEWSAVSIKSGNDQLGVATVYYYIENEEDVPTDGGNYWYYDEEGNPVAW